jgi:hypothetical protein
MIAAEVAANAQLNVAISASGHAQSTQAGSTQAGSTQSETTLTTVIPAGAITWAPGFGPNGVVASVQTAANSGTTATTSTPTTVAGFQSAPQGQGGSAVAGVSNLPSTNTGDPSGLLGLGSALMALGASLLLRLPTKPRK